MQALIEVDLPEEVLSDFEPLAFRVPQDREYFWNDRSKKVEAGHSGMIFMWLVLRPRFKWPGWLNCRFLTWGVNSVFGFNAVPYRDEGGWHGEPVFFSDPAVVQLSFPGGDLDTRVEENPNWGK